MEHSSHYKLLGTQEISVLQPNRRMTLYGSSVLHLRLVTGQYLRWVHRVNSGIDCRFTDENMGAQLNESRIYVLGGFSGL